MRDVSEEALWGLILPYVRRPIPAPLSSPPRSDLRQQTLATCMRVSKLFESICEPLLYSVIATDVLPKLLCHIRSPSMRRRLGRTHRLLIEYVPKPFELSYCGLLEEEDAMWHFVGPTGTAFEENVVNICSIEREHITRHLATSVKAAQGGCPVFRCLETIAISSIYGSEGDCWRKYTEWRNGISEGNELDKVDSAGVFGAFLSTYKVRHLCTRDPYSPLSLKPIIWASDLKSPVVDYTITQHFLPDVDFLLLPLGNTIRWVSDAPPSADLAVSLCSIRETVDQLLQCRKMTPSGFFGTKVWPDVADVQIYCTTATISKEEEGMPLWANLPRPMSKEEQAVLADTVTKFFTRVFRQDSGLADTIKWYTSDETPTCKVCLSGVPV